MKSEAMTGWIGFVVVVCLLLGGGGGLLAADDQARGWQPEPFVSAPEAVLAAAAEVEAEDDADVVLLLEESRYRFDSEGRQEFTTTLVFQLLTKSGIERWSTVEERWEPWHEARPVFQARVIAPDGGVTELDPDTLSESPAEEGGPDVFDDRRVIHGPLPALGEGVVVEERHVARDVEAKYPEGTVRYFFPARSIPVHQARLVVELPAGSSLSYEARLLDGLEPRHEQVDGTERWTFDFFDLEEAEDPELYLPFDEPRFPCIVFSTGSDWQPIADRYDEIVNARLAEADLAELAGQCAAAGGDKSQRIDAALRLVHDQVRYTGLEFGDASIVPASPQEVLARGFGDCKDQATLLVGLLRAMGLQAHVALLRSGFGEDVRPGLPGLGAFNHAIAYVPGDDPLWIDPTCRFCRLGSLPLADHGRQALIVRPGEDGLVTIPVASSADNGEAETREVHLADMGKARVVSMTRAWGDDERRYRRGFSGADREELREHTESWAKNVFFGGELDVFEFSDPENMDQEWQLRAEVKEAGCGLTNLGSAVAAIRVATMSSHFPSYLLHEEDEDEDEDEEAEGEGGEEAGGGESSQKERSQDFVFHQPFTLQRDYTILPPRGFEAELLPDGAVHQLGTVTLEERYISNEDGSVTATFRFDSGKLRLTPEEVKATREALMEFAERDLVMIRFKHVGQAHLDAGRTAEALREFVALAEEEPDNALHHVRLARGLLAAGLGVQARQEGRTAVEVDAESLTAYENLAWILQHDEIGRRFGAGFDREGALAAYRGALELEDVTVDVRGNYAILLEYNADGERYGPGSDLDEAISQYLIVIEELDEDDNDDPNHWARRNLAMARLMAGRFEDIKKDMPAPGKKSKVDSVIFAAVAAVDGVDDAASLIRKRYSDADDRRSQLMGAGVYLVTLRRYQEGAQLLKLAAQGASDAPNVLATVRKLEAIRPHEELELEMGDPSDVVRELLRQLANRDDYSVLAALFAPEFVENLDEEDEGDPARAFIVEMLARVVGSDSHPTDSQVDQAIANAEIRQQCAGESACFVHLRIPTNGSGGWQERIYLVRRDGRWAIMATEYDFRGLGAVALQLLDDGELETARRIMNWAWDEVRGFDSEDPFASSSFSRFWTKGADGDADAVRMAATVLEVGGSRTGQVVDQLKEWVAAAEDEERAAALRFTLLQALVELERYDEAAVEARTLFESYPGSDRVLWFYCDTLRRLGKLDEARAVTAQRLEDDPDDIAAMRTMWVLAAAGSDFDEADRWAGKAIESTDASELDYNNRAWLALFRDKDLDRAIGWAHDSVERSRSHDDSDLHTLAALYAASDMPAEAYQLILKAIEVSADGEPEPHDWFVFGRMAETYGFVEAARGYYERVVAEDDDDETDPTSTYTLAQRRLRLLEAAGQAGAEEAG